MAFVIYNHTTVFKFIEGETLSLGAVVHNSMSGVVKTAVPLFFMITGALLLKKEESLKELFLKRIFRFALLMILFVLLQSVYASGTQLNQFSCHLKEFLLFETNGKGAFTQWFFPVYFATLFLLPLLRSLVKNLDKKIYIYVFIVQILFCGVYYSITNFITAPIHHNICANTIFNSFIVYMLAGYFLENFVSDDSIRFKNLCIFVLLSTVFIVVSSIETCCLGYAYTGNFTLIPCITIYLLVRKLCTYLRNNNLAQDIISQLGAAVLVVLLTENIFRNYLYPLFAERMSSSGFVRYIAAWELVACVLTSSLVLGLLLRKVPLLNKLL